MEILVLVAFVVVLVLVFRFLSRPQPKLCKWCVRRAIWECKNAASFEALMEWFEYETGEAIEPSRLVAALSELESDKMIDIREEADRGPVYAIIEEASEETVDSPLPDR
jgi:hypothetical protein